MRIMSPGRTTMIGPNLTRPTACPITKQTLPTLLDTLMVCGPTQAILTPTHYLRSFSMMTGLGDTTSNA